MNPTLRTCSRPARSLKVYVVDEALGHGGYATVYRAHDARTRIATVALKVLDDASPPPRLKSPGCDENSNSPIAWTIPTS